MAEGGLIQSDHRTGNLKEKTSDLEVLSLHLPCFACASHYRSAAGSRVRMIFVFRCGETMVEVLDAVSAFFSADRPGPLCSSLCIKFRMISGNYLTHSRHITIMNFSRLLLTGAVGKIFNNFVAVAVRFRNFPHPVKEPLWKRGRRWARSRRRNFPASTEGVSWLRLTFLFPSKSQSGELASLLSILVFIFDEILVHC